MVLCCSVSLVAVPWGVLGGKSLQHFVSVLCLVLVWVRGGGWLFRALHSLKRALGTDYSLSIAGL